VEKQQIADEMIVLIRQLVSQKQIRIAAEILKVYFIRYFKVSEEVAAFFMRKYFERHYSVQVRKFRQRFANQGGNANAKEAGTA